MVYNDFLKTLGNYLREQGAVDIPLSEQNMDELIGFPVRNSDGTITWKKLFGE